MEQLYAPSDAPVFQLVPPVFGEHAQTVYMTLGQPPINGKTVWDVYMQLLNTFRGLMYDIALAPVLSSHHEIMQTIENDHIPLLPGQDELPSGGGLENGNDTESLPGSHLMVTFTDEEDDSDAEE